jgi:HD superfamily phosphohydrolase
MPDKVFCDPVYRHIIFDKDKDAVLLQLLGCPEVQRLRRVRQLGVSFLT